MTNTNSETEKKSEIDFIIAKSGHIVPVVDQIYLHSVYDPIKEADDYAQTHEDDLKKNSTVLMLGLGFGYHIFQIINKLKVNHTTFNLLVLEPNQQLVEHFINYCSEKNIKVEFKILSSPIDKIFYQDVLLNFMLQKPLVLMHKASFNKDKSYFTTFLQYRAPKVFETFEGHLKTHLKDFLAEGNFAPNQTIQEAIAASTKKNKLTKADYYLKLYDLLTHS